MDTRRIDIGPVELEVLEAGAGGRPLLLVHGFTGAKEDFADHVDRLASSGWHVVVPDHRGHGASDDPPGAESYSLPTFAADVIALVDALGWDRFALLGHSMGGMIAQHVVIEHPERVAALVLMDTSHGPVEGIDREEVALGQAVVRDHGLSVLVELQRDRNGALDTPAARRLREERPGWAELEEQKTLACAADMWLAMTSELFEQEDRLERLRSVSVPTLVIVGEQDSPFLADSERMAKTIPSARLAVISDAGHSPQVENPEAWWSELASFLEEVA